MDAIVSTPHLANEPVGSFAPSSAERARLRAELTELAATPTKATESLRFAAGTIKETFVPPTEYTYPHQAPEEI